MAKITIDGKEYNADDLSESGRAQVASLQFVDGELLKLQNTVAVYQTAQGAYAKALKSDAEKASKKKPKKK